jgi:hypothetical protein
MSTKRVRPSFRSPGEADVVVLNQPDVPTPQRRGAYVLKRSGAKVLRRTIWLPEDLADLLAMRAAQERTTQASVVTLALRKFLGGE